MRRSLLLAAALTTITFGCGQSASNDEASGNAAVAPTPAAKPAEPVKISLARLHCGRALFKNFDSFFSDRKGLYAPGARPLTDSCYLIQHGDQQMIWDTGFSAAMKGKETDLGELVVSVNFTLAEQLQQLGLAPTDIDVVGISHMHSDHTGQAAQFANARLVIGKGDFEQSRGDEDPFGPWRREGAKVTLASGDVDVFGDGTVTAVHLPGHTPDHLALLVKLASGPVLLSGDLYHFREARQKRGVPPFNTSRDETLKSMDRFEKLAKDTGAKVIIQHEPADVGLLPTFPKAAE